MSKRTLAATYRIFRSFLFDPLVFAQKLRGLSYFARNAYVYRRNASNGSFPLRLRDVYYTSFDRFHAARTAHGHYFHQDLWAARLVAASGERKLVDVGSRVDGFVAHVLPFCDVQYVDIRPLDAEVAGLEYVPGSILAMPFADDAIRLVTCLHVIEHVGLGRYGDPVDPQGPWRAARELARILAPDGMLLLGTPVGRERLMFDAHRIFDPETVCYMFPIFRCVSSR
jgi:SAM-dependent methyltransferase